MVKDASFTVTMKGRQCGQSMIKEMETAMFNVQRDKDIVPTRIEVGQGTRQALMMLPLAYDAKPEGQPDKFMGIVVKVNPLLPEDGYAFIDKFGQVCACGTLLKGTDDV